MKLRTLLQLSLILFGLNITAQANEQVKLVVGDYPPFVEVYSEHHGIISEVVKQAFSEIDIKSYIEYSNWADSEIKVDYENNLSFMWAKNAERHSKWLFSEPLYTSNFVLLARKSLKLNWRYLDDLRPYKVGVIKSYNYSDRFEQYLSVLKVEQSVSDYIGVKKLLNGEMDVLVIEKTVAKQLLSYFHKAQTDVVELIESPLIAEKNSYLVCAKTYAKCFSYIEKFNQGLKVLKQNGVYDKIISSVDKN